MVSLSEADILASIYMDSLEIKRVEYRENDIGELVEEEIFITPYPIKCALSLATNSKPSKDDTYYNDVKEYKVFTKPDIEILAKDKLIVDTAMGQRVVGIAGDSFKYPSHTETILAVTRKV